MSESQISLLLFKYLRGSLTENESKDLEDWKALSPSNKSLFDEIANETTLRSALGEYDPENLRKLRERIFASTRRQLRQEGSRSGQMNRVYRWTIAAAVLLITGLGGYFSIHGRKTAPAKGFRAEVRQPDIEAPKASKAVVTLASGQQIFLDNAANGQLATQGSVKLIKVANGQIAYQSTAGKSTNELSFNTLTNPSGSKVIDIMLSDGTRVWLNSSSSITYPVSFTGNERKVMISGEGYFEVAKNTAMPFKVENSNHWEVLVTGTHFNVNAFPDEKTATITLLEGSVKIKTGFAEPGVLTPGQQAQVGEALKIVSEVDMEAVMAWKNGQFYLNGTDVKTLMRQIARWYDVDVQYKGDQPERQFGGFISRNVSLSVLLQALRQYGIKCELDGRVIVLAN